MLSHISSGTPWKTAHFSPCLYDPCNNLGALDKDNKTDQFLSYACNQWHLSGPLLADTWTCHENAWHRHPCSKSWLKLLEFGFQTRKGKFLIGKSVLKGLDKMTQMSMVPVFPQFPPQESPIIPILSLFAQTNTDTNTHRP